MSTWIATGVLVSGIAAATRPAADPSPSAEEPTVQVDAPPAAPPRPMADGEPDPVMDVVRRGADDLKRCYERMLKARRLRGRVVIEITVEAGTPTGTTVVEDTVSDERMVGCLQETMRRWRFPADLDDTVRVPIVFADE